MTSNIIIYTQDECPPCTFVKNYLSEHGIEYTEKNIKNTQYRNEMINYDAFATPFILLKGEPMYSVDMDKINSTLNIEN
ncbi:glutaredoxin family protein [Staphylococcus caprae]|uniref:glutaredoxin family protein n=1 Tax=Staphylococcus TaxID=1279 RepID=UPI0008A9EB91|nr:MULTISPECIES: glutaredoxin family protein [Staphylococcus]MBU5271359.1 glutaredoxin family protein [Staphylococcus caprae]MDK6297005.1 glutaredoxin family protein [Staphylococcus caprae]MDK7232793.1 glutaredoxin family protein [Staphylococcus caprae]OHO72087.1 NrdH-redoxin [Staphylococcus sp. HMSC036D05]OHS36933.1 NrdH-redoxin [Staphylococcus sp. HMSC62A08]